MSKVKHWKHWTKEETEYLEENWGQISVPALCQNLNRSENAIMIKVQKLGLLPFLESGDYITLNQLISAVTGSSKTYTYKIKSWVEASNETIIAQLSQDLQVVKRRSGTANDFLKTVKRYARMKKFTPEILREFVDKIVVHHRQKVNAADKDNPATEEQKIEIFYNCVGVVNVPEEKRYRRQR